MRMASATLNGETTMTPGEEDNIPKAPPLGLRERYIKISWAYVRWCVGMFVWSMLCIVYFVLTRQTEEMYIAIGLGVILLSMVLGPAFLFGGETWYKRLGWMVILLCMFSLMWVYPMIAVGLGLRKRIQEGRYSSIPHLTDMWHLVLSLMTVVLALWTFVLTKRVVKITRQLARGEFGEMDIRIHDGTAG
ncbi:MAG: hypothetical protein JWN40_2990 [Phycisphaerales bacterium]|nr:hypothetical protein [Phycisphaerales bacterium]